ncbi:MAG: sigma 54-interacting transcriptional regulator [Negativicutes bacterium]|nr:sigma 54-interacting transcriptional regulator [Negativicutes bacterium]
MSKIVFLSPDNAMLTIATKALGQDHSDIRIEKGLLSEGLKVVDQLSAQGTEVFITRGGTASLIRTARPEISIVEVPITGFDVMRAVAKAKELGPKVAVVAFSVMVAGIEVLAPVFGVELRQYIIEHELEAEEKVLRAFQEGADVVLGGVITSRAAQKHNLPYVSIDSGAEGIIQAALEAKRLAHARELEKVKVSLFRSVLDYAYEGIIAVDQACKITILNPVAQRLTQIEEKTAIGKAVQQVWPDLKLERIVQTGQEDLGQLLRIRGVHILCNRVPIQVSGRTVGAIATFQDIGQIQQMEARIRQRVFASGHVAGFSFNDIFGENQTIKDTIRIAKEFALTDSAVLILGETGVGKEVFAQSIHNYSSRARGPFVAINCAALPSQILESELFGYVGGAFTGANRDGKPGLFEIAHEGTIFLDEIAEMDYVTQGKLLRVLQEKKVMRLGSDRVLPVNVRVIAATNKNLKQLVQDNKFRSDLYYRLNVLRLKIPPLRERGNDVLVYAQNFLDRYAGRIRRNLSFSPEALKTLLKYSWPGNIRELQNIVERIVAVCRSELVSAELVLQILEDETAETACTPVYSEVHEIKEALQKAKGKYTAAAKLLGISRSTLWRKIRQYGIT